MSSDIMNSINLVQKYLGVLSYRQNVISDNIANVDTANFKRSKVSFESELKKALKESNSINLDLKIKNDRHLKENNDVNYLDLKPVKILDYLTSSNNNGNNVDIDSEVKSLVQNQMMYDLMTGLASFHFKAVNTVIK